MSHASAETLEVQRLVLEEITNKWTLLVLNALCPAPMRFNALKRELNGVSQKALTQCLRRLEAIGFIERRVESLSPVAVSYCIAPLGRSLEPHIKGLLFWAEDHKDQVLRFRQAA